MMRSLALPVLCLTLLGIGHSTPADTSDAKLKLYIWIAEECPISVYMSGPLQQIADKYADQVDLFCVFPMRNSTLGSAGRFLKEQDLDRYQLVLDKEQSLTKAFGATVTPEAIVVDQHGEVRYRGRINDAFFAPGKRRHRTVRNDLDIALTEIVQGRSAVAPWPEAIGCFITPARTSVR